MSNPPKLPVTLNEAYGEPKNWKMPKGNADLYRITADQMAMGNVWDCKWIAFDKSDKPIAVFRSIAVALTYLVEGGYNVKFILE